MPYFAAGRVVTVTPEEARATAGTNIVDIAMSKGAALDVMDIDGALLRALYALASEKAPHALRLFIDHWTTGSDGRRYMIAGDHANVLSGDALDAALAATEALLLDCMTNPEAIAATLEAADLPHGMDAESASADLYEAASRAAPKTVAEANAAFDAAYAGDHLSAKSLYAWLAAFAATLRHARDAGESSCMLPLFDIVQTCAFEDSWGGGQTHRRSAEFQFYAAVPRTGLGQLLPVVSDRFRVA